MSEVKEKWLGLVGLNELLCLGGQAIGEVLSFRGLVETRHHMTFLACIRCEVTGWGAGLVAADIRIETVIGRQRSRAAQMPFADVAGYVTRRFEHFGQRLFRRGKLHDRGCAKQLAVG